MSVLSIKNLSVGLRAAGHSPSIGDVPLIQGVDIDIEPKQIVAIVGESGCGKTTLGNAILRLGVDGMRLQGSISFDGLDLLNVTERQMRSIRGARIGLVGQDPLDSLNPTQRVGVQIADALRVHGFGSRRANYRRVIELMNQCGLRDAALVYDKYPHMLSGGMRQRIAIAMAMACRPALLIADEPTTSLDNTVQAQILRLLREVVDGTDTSVLLITHDLGIVREVADVVVVLYAGIVVESGPMDEVLSKPTHPYTAGLLGAVPGLAAPGERIEPLVAIPGSSARPGEVTSGCRFRPRCQHQDEECALLPPLTARDAEGHHGSRCWHPVSPASSHATAHAPDCHE